jgi:signal transduction histidine kinase
VVQEGLTNIQKHARARVTSVVLEKHLGQVSVILEDDGVGFNVAEVFNTPNPEKRLGLVGMKERLSNVSGTLDIESAPGCGTTLYFRIPVTSD